MLVPIEADVDEAQGAGEVGSDVVARLVADRGLGRLGDGRDPGRQVREGGAPVAAALGAMIDRDAPDREAPSVRIMAGERPSHGRLPRVDRQGGQRQVRQVRPQPTVRLKQGFRVRGDPRPPMVGDGE